MITGLRYQNFKSWKDTGQIRMAPLTGFFGTNSSGKTALLQFLLLMKQTVESNDRARILHTGDDKSYVDVGTFDNIIHKKQIPGQLEFSLDWNLKETAKIGLSIGLSNGVQNAQPIPIQANQFHFDNIISGTGKEVTLKKFNYTLSDIHQSKYRFGLHQKSTKTPKAEAIYELVSQGYEVKPGFLPNRASKRQLDQPARLQPVKSYGFPDAAGLYYNTYNLFYELAFQFETVFRNTYYLGPIREKLQRIYLLSGERPENIGVRGELAIPALIASDISVTQHIATWLKKLELIHSFKLQPIAKGRKEYEALVQITPESAEVSIADVGFGLSQVLPILTLCYYVPEGSTIIFEQPEIHLHPSVQAGLADVFIDVIKTRHLQIILESHSEHFLHRLQRRIAENQLLPETQQKMTSDQTALYFCELNDNGEAEIKELDIDKYGNIKNWPENFFGDELGDLIAMTEAEMTDRIKKESPIPV